MKKTWMHRWALAGVAIGCLSATAFAAVGDLEYSKSPPPGRGLYVQFKEPVKVDSARKLEQLGAADAMLGEGSAGGIKVMAAAIRTKAGAKDFDVMRVDLTGKGNFAGTPPLELKTVRRTASLYYAAIEPAQVTLNKDGVAIPVSVGGYYYESNGKPRMRLTLSAAAEGLCAFGKTPRKVRILDTSGSLSFGDGTGSRVDMVQVADETGRLPSAQVSPGTRPGQPVQVAGAWYTTKVAGMKVSAEPLKAPLGKIAGKADHWELALTGKKYRIIVHGANEAVAVPADTYTVTRCLYLRPDKRGQAVPVVMSYPGMSLVIEAGQTQTVPMGLPMRATTEAKVSGRTVRLSVKRTDAVGHRIVFVMNAAGERPVAPMIDVVDKTGKVVYTAKLEYG